MPRRRQPTTTRLLALAVAGLLTLGLAACSGDGADPATSEPTSAQATETAEPTPSSSPTPEPEPAAVDINGRWCPTPESPAGSGCVTVALQQLPHQIR